MGRSPQAGAVPGGSPQAGAVPGGSPQAGAVPGGSPEACAGASPLETAGGEGAGVKERRPQGLRWGLHIGEGVVGGKQEQEDQQEPHQDWGRKGWGGCQVRTESSRERDRE